jgi:hypoxia up-regulated 1
MKLLLWYNVMCVSLHGSILLSLIGLARGKKAILGVDLGSLYMKVALVQRNSPLQIVTNMHSKRKTEQMVLFDDGARFYGADASSLLARKPHLTPAAMTVMLGRHHEHPTVRVLSERHYPVVPTFNETRSGVMLTVDGVPFTPEELVAMVLTHARDISAIYGDMPSSSMVRDIVLTVPSFYTIHERRALLDAAALADLNVLALIDENTAAALHYGMDRIETEPKYLLFFNMGASATQVSVIRFFSYEHKDSKYAKGRTVGAFEVLGKGWDTTLGGETFDARLVNYMADHFNKEWDKKRNDGLKKDVRENKRAMTKLRLMANKVKHVLSANSDSPVFIESLQDDLSLSMTITRAEFEQVCHDLFLRASVPVQTALRSANLTLEQIDSVELIGGGMRIPKFQEELSKVLGSKLELGMHINSDESMALGAAFHGANVSTAFKVRHVGMTDVNPFSIQVSLETIEEVQKRSLLGGLFGIGSTKKAAVKDEKETIEAEATSTADESAVSDGPWQKKTTLFSTFGKVGIKKTIAFTQDQDVHCSLDYEPTDYLPEGTE